jgi:hypothetical protein
MLGIRDTNKVVSPWENSLESLKEFLSRPDIEIYDEYGVRYTPEQFWDEEVGESLYNDPQRFINGAQYDERGREKMYFFTCEESEFTSEDGLRFSKTNDFS